MRTSFLRHVSVFAALILAAWLGVAGGNARAAALAEEHTILYYLIEMQRQHGAPCDGSAKAKLPSLTPSDSLRAAAQELTAPGKTLQGVMAARGAGEGMAFFATATGPTPQNAFEALKTRYCSSLMNPLYHYVGAVNDHGTWFVVLSKTNPGDPAPAPLAGQNPENAPPAIVGEEPPVPQEAAAAPPAPRQGITPLTDDRPPQEAPVHVITAPGMEDPATAGVPAGAQAGRSGAAPDTAANDAPVYLVVEEETTPGAAPTAAATAETRVPPASAYARQPEEEQMLALVNEARTQGSMCGGVLQKARPLKGNAVLFAVASRHAKDMALRQFFSSKTPEGVSLGKRLSDSGYTWEMVAENIASGGLPPRHVLENWLRNPAQCKNLMNNAYTDVGVGYAPDKGYWVLTLAAPMSEGALRLE